MHEFCILTCLTISWMKDPLGVLLIGENFPPLGKTTFFFFITYWGFVLIPLSWEFYQLHWGSFILQLLRGLLLCLGTTGESFYDTKICLGIWLMILTHEGVSRWFLSNSLRDVFYAFDPLWMLLRVFMFFGYLGHTSLPMGTDGVLKVPGPFLGLWKGLKRQLGASMLGLLLFFLGHA